MIRLRSFDGLADVLGKERPVVYAGDTLTFHELTVEDANAIVTLVVQRNAKGATELEKTIAPHLAPTVAPKSKGSAGLPPAPVADIEITKPRPSVTQKYTPDPAPRGVDAEVPWPAEDADENDAQEPPPPPEGQAASAEKDPWDKSPEELDGYSMADIKAAADWHEITRILIAAGHTSPDQLFNEMLKLKDANDLTRATSLDAGFKLRLTKILALQGLYAGA